MRDDEPVDGRRRSSRRRSTRGLTAFALSVGQSLSFVVAAAVGFWVLRRQHGHLGLRSTAMVYVKLAVPALLTALALSWAIGTLLPRPRRDAGASRAWSPAASCWRRPAPSQLAVTWGVAHALGVREIGAALEPLTRRLRRR